MKIARVFTRRTKATPDDELAYSLIHSKGKILNWEQAIPGMYPIEADEVHVSVTFTYDLKIAERLEKAWRHIAPVKVGGPALDDPGDRFEQGLYVKPGYTLTSRGCPNNCWFCSVPKREGNKVREYDFPEGNNILDSNILACSDDHIRKVFAMLKRQKYGRPEFTGGLEAKRLKDWHVDLLREVKPKELFFAYDTPDDLEPLVEAGKKLHAAGFTGKSHELRAYVLIGYRGDKFDKAEKRLNDTIKAGFMPNAMLYRDEKGIVSEEWAKFQREWNRPAIVNSKMREVLSKATA